MNNSKIQITHIGKKKVVLDPTMGGFEKLNKRWGIREGDTMAADFRNEFCIDAIWTAMKRRFIFKPFITKKRMKKYMKPWDMDRITIMTDWVYTGKIFTDDELSKEVEKRRKEIAEEMEKIRAKWKTMTEDEIASMIDKQSGQASDTVKKNG